MMNNDDKGYDDSKLKIAPIDNETIQAKEIESERLEDSIGVNDDPLAPASEEVAGVVQGIGHQLRAGRLARNMSIEEVAYQLRLSVRQIEAMEKEDYEKLPGRTFLRGFIRNYANLVRLNAVSILQMLPPSAAFHSNTNASFQASELSTTNHLQWGRSDFRTGNNKIFLLKVASVIFLLLLIVYLVFRVGDWEEVSKMANEVETGIMSEMGAASDPASIELDLPIPLPSVMPSNNPDTSDLTTLSTMAPHINSVSSEGVVHLKFSNESLVEIKDGSNEIIFKQTNARGTEQMLSGQRPLSFVINRAVDVNLNYNGRLVDLEPYTNDEGIARFMLE